MTWKLVDGGRSVVVALGVSFNWPTWKVVFRPFDWTVDAPEITGGDVV